MDVTRAQQGRTALQVWSKIALGLDAGIDNRRRATGGGGAAAAPAVGQAVEQVAGAVLPARHREQQMRWATLGRLPGPFCCSGTLFGRRPGAPHADSEPTRWEQSAGPDACNSGAIGAPGCSWALGTAQQQAGVASRPCTAATMPTSCVASQFSEQPARSSP